jgi:hypothetical protein
MAGSDDVRAATLEDLIEEGSPRPAGRDFKGKTLAARQGGHVNAIGDERQREMAGERARMPLVLVGLRAADAVMQMSDGIERQRAARVQIGEQEEQPDRVGAT